MGRKFTCIRFFSSSSFSEKVSPISQIFLNRSKYSNLKLLPTGHPLLLRPQDKLGSRLNYVPLPYTDFDLYGTSPIHAAVIFEKKAVSDERILKKLLQSKNILDLYVMLRQNGEIVETVTTDKISDLSLLPPVKLFYCVTEKQLQNPKHDGLKDELLSESVKEKNICVEIVDEELSNLNTRRTGTNVQTPKAPDSTDPTIKIPKHIRKPRAHEKDSYYTYDAPLPQKIKAEMVLQERLQRKKVLELIDQQRANQYEELQEQYEAQKKMEKNSKGRPSSTPVPAPRIRTSWSLLDNPTQVVSGDPITTIGKGKPKPTPPTQTSTRHSKNYQGFKKTPPNNHTATNDGYKKRFPHKKSTKDNVKYGNDKTKRFPNHQKRNDFNKVNNSNSAITNESRQRRTGGKPLTLPPINKPTTAAKGETAGNKKPSKKLKVPDTKNKKNIPKVKQGESE